MAKITGDVEDVRRQGLGRGGSVITVPQTARTSLPLTALKLDGSAALLELQARVLTN